MKPLVGGFVHENFGSIDVSLVDTFTYCFIYLEATLILCHHLLKQEHTILISYLAYAVTCFSSFKH